MNEKLLKELLADILYSLKYTHEALNGEIRAFDPGFSNLGEAHKHCKLAEKSFNELFEVEIKNVQPGDEVQCGVGENNI